MCPILGGLLVLAPVMTTAAPAQAEWVYRTVRVCEPRNRYVQRCAPVRQCDTKYRYESVLCSTCRPQRHKSRRVPYKVCYTQTRCRREVVTGKSCRNVQRRVWVENPKRIPEKVPPAQDD